MNLHATRIAALTLLMLIVGSLTASAQYICKATTCIVVSPQGWIVGEIKTFAFGEPPPNRVMKELARQGWVECAGQPISKDDYPALSNVIGDGWGSSDGFKVGLFLPDLRGQFLRGWNHSAAQPQVPALGGDPEATTRLSPRVVATGGSPGNSGNAIGSIEDSAIGNHTHRTPNFGFAQLHNTEFGNGIGGLYNGAPLNDHFDTGAVVENHTENRPHNVYVLYAIFMGVPSVLDDNDIPTPVAGTKRNVGKKTSEPISKPGGRKKAEGAL